MRSANESARGASSGLPGGSPCAPLGKTCGVELHLPLYVETVHRVTSGWIEPYLDNIHENDLQPVRSTTRRDVLVLWITCRSLSCRPSRPWTSGGDKTLGKSAELMRNEKGQHRLFVRRAVCGS